MIEPSGPDKIIASLKIDFKILSSGSKTLLAISSILSILNFFLILLIEEIIFIN